jgi:hypothetical protein
MILLVVLVITLVIKNDVLDCNIIIELKNAIIFEHVFPLKNKEKNIA